MNPAALPPVRGRGLPAAAPGAYTAPDSTGGQPCRTNRHP